MVRRRACRIEDVATVGYLGFAARTFGVQLHDGDPAYRRGFGADPQPCELGQNQSLHQHCAMQMVLVLGATSKVNEQVQFAQQVYQNPCRTLALSQRLEYSARSPTSTPVGCADVITCTLGGCAQGIAISVHFFGIAGDVEYALVLVDKGSASFAGSCKHSYGSCTLVWVRDKHWQTSATSPRQKCAATCSPSWTASLW